MTPSANCLFCRIIAGEVTARIVYADDLVTAIRDINPQAPTHILLLPNRHISGIDEASEADARLLAALFLTAPAIAREQGLAEGGYRLVVNQGADAGQSVFHLHVHLLGGRRLKWPPG
jgi:diadenosine tetraphosphate (Ap4A) HIT family hydrolase